VAGVSGGKSGSGEVGQGTYKKFGPSRAPKLPITNGAGEMDWRLIFFKKPKYFPWFRLAERTA
jgi:hypothetical protein